MRLAALAIVSGLMSAATGCMVEVGRYRAYADVGSDRSRIAAIRSFERTHAVTRIAPAVISLPKAAVPIGAAPIGRREWISGDTSAGGDRVVVFSSAYLRAHEHVGPWDHACDGTIAYPRYRFYRAADGHFVILRLVPDVRTNEVRTLASTLSIVDSVTLYLAECGDHHRSPRPHGVVLGPGDPARVEVVDAHFDRAVIRERR